MREWQRWLKKYQGPTEAFMAEEQHVEPGQVGFKTGWVILTRMITQNPVRNPSTLSQYMKLI
jgi:hypothetical protein